MPLGAFRTGFLGSVSAAAAGGEPGGTYRTAVNVTAYGNAQIDNTTYNVGSGSVVLDGTGDYLGTDFAHPDMTEFTFECWFRLSSLKDNMFIWQGDNGVSNARHQIWITGPNRATQPNEVVVATGSGGSYTFNVNFGTTTWATNTWYHLAVTRNSSNSITVWVNGVSKGSATDSKAFFSSSATPLIGRSSYDTNADFPGYLDEIRISSTCRYTTGFTPDTAGFTDDENTLMLLHLDTDFSDDNSYDTSGGGAAVGGSDTATLDDDITNTPYNNIMYVGDNNTNEPVFLAIWRDNTTSGGNAHYQMFSVATDGTITKGTMYDYDATNGRTLYGISDRDYSGAGYQAEDTEGAYGIARVYNYGTSTDKWVAFEADPDAKTLTFGTEITLSDAVGNWDTAYLGSGKYVTGIRGGNNSSYLVTATFSRSGTTLTYNNDETVQGATSGMGILQMQAFDGDKFVATATGNNQDGALYTALRQYSGTFYELSGGANGNEFLSGNETDTKVVSVAPMNTTNKVAFLAGNNTGSGADIGTYLRIGEVTWGTGTTSPTVSLGTLHTLDSATPSSTYGAKAYLLPDPSTSDAGKVWIVDGGTLQYKNFTVSGTTISSDATWTDTSISVSAIDQRPNGTCVHRDGASYYVLGFENSTGSDYDVVAFVE